MNLASTRRNWPTGRGFERFYGFLGAETNQWYPGPGLRQPPGRPADDARGGLPPHRGPHRQGARVHQGRQGDRAGQAVLPLLRARAPATPRTTPRRSGSTGSRAGSTWATRRCASRRWPARRRWASSRPTPSCRRSTRSARPRPAPGPDGQPFPALDYTRPWDSLSDEEKRLFSRMAEVYAGFLAHADAPDRAAARLPGGDRPAREHDGHRRLRQRRQRRGRPERVGQRDASSPTASPTTSSENLAMLDELGGPKTYNHYPNGWAMAFNTPFKMWKRYEFNGGTSRPVHHLLARRASTARGEIREQYHHAIDLVPTILDALGVEPPETIKGHTPEPLRRRQHALQLRRRRRCPARARRSSTRCSARAAIWHDGWKAVTTHPTLSGWSHFNDDTWELYHVDVDRSELHDLAAEQPEQAARAGQPLVRRGRRQRRVPARRPLRAGDPHDAAAAAHRRRATATSTTPDIAEVPESQAVNIRNRSFAIGALVDIPAPGAAGRAVRPRLALRRPRPLRQGQPAALRQQLRRQRRAEDRRRPRSCRPART